MYSYKTKKKARESASKALPRTPNGQWVRDPKGRRVLAAAYEPSTRQHMYLVAEQKEEKRLPTKKIMKTLERTTRRITGIKKPKKNKDPFKNIKKRAKRFGKLLEELP